MNKFLFAVTSFLVSTSACATDFADACTKFRFAEESFKENKPYYASPSGFGPIYNAEMGMRYWRMQCDKQREAEELAAKRKREIEEKAAELASRPGARIGMSREEVRNETSWGEPRLVNRTTTKYGVNEQWVYGNGNYLYFENGKLTAIQN